MDSSTILKIVIGAFAGGIISQIINKLRNRITTLTWERHYQRLATSDLHPDWGELKVLYNGQERKNLSFVSVKIQNESSNDLEDLELRLNCIDESSFLISSGYYDKNARAINFTEQYAQQLTNAKKTSEINFVVKNRSYHVPVLNRGSSITFELLVSSPNNYQPNIQVSSLHKSVQLKYSEPKQKLLNEDQGKSALIGIALTVIAGYFLIYFQNQIDFNLGIIIIAIFALAASLIGALTIKAYKLSRVQPINATEAARCLRVC